MVKNRGFKAAYLPFTPV